VGRLLSIGVTSIGYYLKAAYFKCFLCSLSQAAAITADLSSS
jgi:hypothetical protein